MTEQKRVVVLENIRSAHNVGSVFRTADGAGVQEVWLVGYTPSPIDRFGRAQPEIKKTSLGAAETMTWRYFETTTIALDAAAAEELEVVAVEQAENSITYETFSPNQDQTGVAFVLGNEVDGVSEECLTAADTVIEIPMSGQKESLNVSVTAGIILFATRQ